MEISENSCFAVFKNPRDLKGFKTLTNLHLNFIVEANDNDEQIEQRKFIIFYFQDMKKSTRFPFLTGRRER